MAELSYSDVQRAVQDATRDMRDNITRLTQQIPRFNAMETQVTLMRQEIEGMRRQINATNIQVSNMLARPIPSSNSNDTRLWQQLGNSIHSIDARLVLMQKYLADVSDYVAFANDKSREDEQYRSS